MRRLYGAVKSESYTGSQPMNNTSANEHVRELYDMSADWYAKLMDKEIENPIYKELLGRLAKNIRHIKGAVVDTSCGPGHVLALYREQFDPDRALVGIDLSPKMVELARTKLAPTNTAVVGDMQHLDTIESDSAAAVLSFFALHHLSGESVEPTLKEWARVLVPGGRLVIAAWEGTGPIDYGEQSDVIALRYTRAQVAGWMTAAGFFVDRCRVEPVEDMSMDAIYAEGRVT